MKEKKGGNKKERKEAKEERFSFVIDNHMAGHG